MNWRDYGDMPREAFSAELRRMNSPMLAEADAIYSVVTGYSRLFLAMAYHETKLATVSTVEGFDPRTFKNPVALMFAGKYEMYPYFSLASWAWRDRLVDNAATYKGGVYARTETLEDLIHVYAPASAGNDEARYVAVVKERLAAYGWSEGPMALHKLKPVMMAGCTTPVMIPAELEFRIELIPASQTNQRPGGGFNGGSASYYTQHETANTGFGAGAAMHSRYLHQGAPDGNGQSQQLGYHLTVDDKLLVQMIPLNEKTWHAGDSGGPGNFDSVACELCVNVDSDRALSRELSAIVAAGVMDALAIPTVVQHNHWSGKDCPHIIREINYWPTYLNLVGQYRGATIPAEDVYAAPELTLLTKLGAYDGTDKTVDGTTFFACQRTMTARRTTRRAQVASPEAKPIGPDIKKGEQAPVLYWFKNQNKGTAWFLTKYGTRLRGSHFTPNISFTVPT